MSSSQSARKDGRRALGDAANRTTPSPAQQRDTNVTKRKRSSIRTQASTDRGESGAIATAGGDRTTADQGVQADAATAAAEKKKKRKRDPHKKDGVQLFAFSNKKESSRTPSGRRPKRRPKAVVRFDQQQYDSRSKETPSGCKTGYGFDCPQCSAACSYDSRRCEKCQLECYYEAGVGVVVLKERRRAAAATAAAAGGGITINESRKERPGANSRAAAEGTREEMAMEGAVDSPSNEESPLFNDTSGGDVFDDTPEKVGEQEALASNVELEEVKRQLEEARSRVADLESKLGAVTTERDAATSSNEELTRKVSDLETKFNSVSDNNKQLARKASGLESKLNEASHERDEAMTINDQLVRKVSDLESTLEESAAAKEEVTQKLAGLESSESAQRGKVEQLEKVVRQLSDALSSATSAVQDHQLTSTRLEAANEARFKLLDQVSDLEKKLSTVKAERDQLCGRVSDLEGKAASEDAGRSELDEQLKGLTKQLSGATSLLEKRKRNILELRNKVSRLLTKNEDISSERNQLLWRKNELEASLNAVFSTQRGEIERRVDSLTGQLAWATRKAEERASEIEQLQSNNDSLVVERDHLDKLVKKLEAERLVMRNLTLECDAKKKSLKSALDELVEQLELANEQLEAAREDRRFGDARDSLASPSSQPPNKKRVRFDLGSQKKEAPTSPWEAQESEGHAQGFL